MAGMKARTRYALVAALDLAARYDGGGRCKLREIAARTGTPQEYLVQILLSLKRRALVNSARGPKGGYWLTRPPDRITVAQVIDAVDPRGKHPLAGQGSYGDAVDRLWRTAQDAGWRYLAGVTLADVLEAVDVTGGSAPSEPAPRP
jgi:Rrf2 family iron-sulfur cluster assembly transcriptional regulator